MVITIRHTVLAFFVLGLCVYAWRDWFVSLCGLILLTTLSQHHDTPHAMFGIPGLNPWNLVFFVVLAAWLVRDRIECPGAPRWLTSLVVAYLVLLVVGAVRAMLDADTLAARETEHSFKWLLFELVLNPFKYMTIGLLVYDGCRTRRNVRLALGTLMAFALAHSLLMYKTFKLRVFTGTYDDARRLANKLMGLHANDLAYVLTFGFWAAVVAALLLRGKWRWVAAAVAIVIFPTMVGCHSLSAYIGNVSIALVLAAVRLRRLLILVPIGLALALPLFPQIMTRLDIARGLGADPVTGQFDWNLASSGRTRNLWVPTIQSIMASPLLGYGRLGIVRADCYDDILETEGYVAGHPHNSYLEILLDSGIIGLVIVLGLLGSAAWMAVSLFRTRGDLLFILVGGLGCVAIAGVLGIANSGSIFYPRESMQWLFCSIALTVRMWSVRRAAPAPAALATRAGLPAAPSPYQVQPR